VTTVKEAHDHYLLGRDLARTFEEERSRRALAEFERAVALDPSYAPAWAGIANALRYLEGFAPNGEPSAAQRRRALEAAERAIVLGPELPDGYVARARIRRGFLLDWAGARADLERARALGPGDAFAAWASGQLLMTYGELPAALAQLQRAVELDPLSVQAWTTLGQVQLSGGDHQGGRASLARALEIAPLQDESQYYMFASLLVTGQAAEALKAAQSTKATWIRYLGLALAQHDLGHARESREALEALIATDGKDAAYQVAEGYAWRGEREQAFEWLERARVQADTGLGWIKVDPLLAKLRGDPRYPAMLKKLKLPVD
jgi:serine/threonine-protein kinase